VLIFNRSLSAAEISSLYDSAAIQYQNNFTNLADGEHNFTGHAVDLAGNRNSTENRIVTIDTIAPTVTIDYPTDGATLTTSYVNITGTASDTNPDNITINLSIFGSNLGTFTSWNFTNISMADGTYSAKVTAADTAGNEATDEVTFTVSTDSTAPEVFILSPQNITYPNGTINFNATVLELNPDSGLVQVTMLDTGQGAANYTLVNASGIWGYTNASMPDGVYRAEFFFNDTAGNINFTESVIFTVDTVAPTISIEYPTDGETLNVTYLNITGTASDTNPSTITINDTRFGSNLGTFTSFNFTNTSLADGTYSVQVTATDAAGNNATDEVTFTINQFAITGCRELDTENAVYTLLNDIFTTTNCFNITANNVTLDLNDKNISGDQFGDATYDIAVWNRGYNDSTVKNGNLYEFVYGIYFLNTWGFNITKMNITGNMYFASPGSALGMFIDASGNGSVTHSNMSNLNSSNSFFPRASGIGIQIRNTNNTLVRDNIASGNKDDGFIFSGGHNITFLNNTAIGNLDDGLTTSARDSLFQNNTFTNNGIFTGANGVRFGTAADRNTFRDNVMNGNNIGLLIGQADNNTFINNIIKNSTEFGVELFLLSSNNVIDTLIIDNTTGHAFHMSSGATDNNTLINVNITGTKVGFADLKIASVGIDNLTIEDSNINNYSISGAGSGGLGLIIRNSLYGEIRFLNFVNGSGPNLTQDIRTEFNEAIINSSQNPTQPGVNQSANVTLYGTPSGGETSLVIIRNGIQCGACVNYTQLSAATVIFSVGEEGNYSIGNDSFDPVISIDVNDTVISLFDNETLKIDWNVTDDNLDTIRLNITAPDNSLFLETTDQFSDIILFASNFTEGGLYVVWVYANDTAGNQVTAFDLFLVVPGNQPPTQTTPVITPDPAFADDTLQCSTTPTDHESINLSVFFLWFLNGQHEISTFDNVPAINNTPATSTLSWALVKGQEWICQAQSNDGSGGSVVTNSSAVVIQNSPPFVDIPETFNSSIGPAGTFNIGDTVVIKANVTDVDGQGDLVEARINITDSSPLLRVTDSTMTPLEAITNGFIYGFNYTISPTETAGGTWTIDVNALDTDGEKGSNTTTFIVIIPVPGVHSFVITLTLNNTNNTVYIPGIGEQASLGIGPATYTNPTAFYLATYLNDNLKGLVFSLETPTSIGVDSATGEHELTLKQDLPNSQVFLVFTRGDYQTINSEIQGIKSGQFLEAFYPTFAYGPGLINTVTVLLEYASIDIQGDFDFENQDRSLIVEDLGRDGDREIIKIEVV